MHVYRCIHTYIHTCIHTYIHACMHTNVYIIHIYIRIYIHTYIIHTIHVCILCIYTYQNQQRRLDRSSNCQTNPDKIPKILNSNHTSNTVTCNLQFQAFVTYMQYRICFVLLLFSPPSNSLLFCSSCKDKCHYKYFGHHTRDIYRSLGTWIYNG